MRTEFEIWAEECVRIADKLTGAPVPFILNAPQRRLLAVMERQRLAGRPVRIILLKARQWGGSTLVQTYMAWLQLTQRRDCHSLICAHVRDAAAGIRGMYSALLRSYPEHRREGDPKLWSFLPYERSQSVSWIPARGCRVAIASAGAPDSLRGSSYSMAHLSEVAFWGEDDSEAAERIVRTVCGTVPAVAGSLIVMESTANGRGNYFHDEWQRAVAGESDKTPVFVAWHEIELYRRDVSDADRPALLKSLTPYERALLRSGVALESVAWYHEKRREYPTHEAMMAEFPSTPDEAFASSRRQSPFRDADTLPGVVRPDVSGWRPLIVAVAASREENRAAALFDIAPDAVHARAEIDPSGTMPRLAGRLCEECRRRGARLLLLDPAEEGHARWLAEECARLGADLCHDEEETAWLALTPSALAAMTDSHHRLTASGRFSETDDAMRAEYTAFRPEAPLSRPRVVTRLAAAWAAARAVAPLDVTALFL